MSALAYGRLTSRCSRTKGSPPTRLHFPESKPALMKPLGRFHVSQRRRQSRKTVSAMIWASMKRRWSSSPRAPQGNRKASSLPSRSSKGHLRRRSAQRRKFMPLTLWCGVSRPMIVTQRPLRASCSWKTHRHLPSLLSSTRCTTPTPPPSPIGR